MLITIDGGSASGKSTLAREFSERFEIPLLESGSIYRSLTLRALQAGIDFTRESLLIKFVLDLSLKMHLVNRNWLVAVQGEIYSSHELRGPDVSEKVGLLSRIPEIRARVLPLQWACSSSKKGFLIAEGRDMGTVVFPRAQVKIFLTVSDDEMARRRQRDFEAEGFYLAESEVKRQESERNRLDKTRKVSPLEIPKDAVVINTTGREPWQTLLEVITRINTGRRPFSWLYLFFKMLRIIPKVHLNFSESGREFIPKRGGFILAANHSSHIDPVMLGFGSQRALTFIARSTLFKKNPFFTWLIRSCHAYPLNRENPDRRSLAELNHMLLEGHGLLFFPEGTRTMDGQVGVFKKGVGAFAVRTLFPVIPAYISGSFEAMPRGHHGVKRGNVHVRFGPPVDLTELYPKKVTLEVYEEASRRIREAVLKLKN